MRFLPLLLITLTVCLPGLPAQAESNAAAQLSSELASELARIKNLPGADASTSDVTNLRQNSLKEAAYTFGVQSGAAWRQQASFHFLETQQLSLNRIFDFSPLLLAGKVVPPIILDGGSSFAVEGTSARSVQRKYIIAEQPRMVSQAPNWREYLLVPFETITQPHKAILPKNSAEQKVWNAEIDRGFAEGVRHADYVFQLNLNRLVRDLRGIIRFHNLQRQNIVSMPRVTEGDMGIILDGNELSIGETVFRVNEVEFQKAVTWKP